MRLNRLLDVTVVVIFLLSSFFLVNVTTAEGAIESRVEASFDIELETATDFKISVTMDVSEITAFETTYGSSDIQNLAASVEYDDIITMGGIMQTLHDLLKNQIGMTFENANVVPLNTRPTYENTVFYEEYMVNPTSIFFGMNETVNSHDFVNGVLDMDAIVAYTFNLQAEPGWNNTYTITLPKSMDYNRTTGIVDGNRISWVVENGDEKHPEMVAELSIRLVEPTTSKSNAEDISLEFELDTRNIKTTSLKTSILAKHADIRDYNILPDFITNLDFVPADGIRLFIDNGLISSWDDFYQKTIKPVEQSTISIIENSIFNQTLQMSFSWDPDTTTNSSNTYSITNMDNEPAIKAELLDSDVDLQICGISTRAIFGLVNAGAGINISAKDINFGDKLADIGYQYTGYLYLPDDVSLAGANIYDWNQSNPMSGEFKSDNATSYSNEKIDTLVEIEVSGTDLNLLSFFTGNTELTLTLDIQESRNYSVTIIPDEFSLPEKVSLKYLNSDAFRLCVEENIFSEDNITAFLTNERGLFESRLANILHGLDVINGHVDRDVFDRSLASWDGDIADMDDDPPVRVAYYAHSSYPVSFGLSFIPPKFEISSQDFSFVGPHNQSVTYRVFFPHGTTVEISDSDRAVVGKTDDGRYYMELSFDAAESGVKDVVSCKIVPSALFVVGIFMPCIVSLIIAVILVLVIYIIGKKRRRGKKDAVSEEEGFVGYEDREYYMPPPPSSSK